MQIDAPPDKIRERVSGKVTMKKIYTPEEIAENLQASKRAVYNWVEKGELKAFRAGKLIRVTREDLEKFLGRSIPWE